MTAPPVVVKLGGDALHSPQRIAAAARRLARLARSEPVVAVVSARRGVTDHLLSLVEDVRTAVGAPARAHPEADRAVASGEVVTASLLALALDELGVESVSLDAREAGVRAGGSFGGASIRRIAPGRLRSLLDRGVVPVITGFQGWQRGRVATLGRGGTDTTAVALAAALGASRVVFVKDALGLRTADPKLVPDSRPIPKAPHRFLTALAAAGARVLRAEAAQLGDQHRLRLEFHGLDGDRPLTVVADGIPGAGVRAVTLGSAVHGSVPVTAVFADPAEIPELAVPLERRLAAAGIPSVAGGAAYNGLRLLVPEPFARTALLALHEALAGPVATAVGAGR
jgi:aspartate kinase